MLYARLSQDPVRRALEQAHANMFAAAGVSVQADIIPFPPVIQKTDTGQT